MKLFTGGIATETNTFSPMPTGRQQFEGSVYHPAGVPDDVFAFGQPLVVFRRRARERGWEVAEGLYAMAQPAGATVRTVYESLRDALLRQLREALPVDGVLLNLHGAMVAEGYDDCEGDLLARVRALVGPGVPVGAELDPHCQLTEAMVTAADALVCYKEYPHTDQAERAEELFRIVADAMEGRTRPHMAVYDCRMISNYFTTTEPMRGYVARLKALEGSDGVLSISVAHGFPWADIPDVSTKLLVVTDAQPERGAALARELGLELIGLRGRTHAPYLTLEESLECALGAERGPVVVADVSDNAGGGAPSDSTYMLRALLARGARDVALAMVWDPVAVSMAFAAGEGAQVVLRLGGKLGPMSGDPVDAVFTVTRLREDARMRLGDTERPTGPTAALHCRGVDVIANAWRMQTTHPDLFAQMGIDPLARRVLVVKSAQHFRAGFEPIASEILYAAGPGAIAPDFAHIPYTRVRRPVWPLDPHLHDDR